MLNEFTKAVSAISDLCVTLQSNQDGARYLLALALIAAAAFMSYWALK